MSIDFNNSKMTSENSSKNSPKNSLKVAIVGSGIAGLLSALLLAESGISVKLFSKGELVQSNTSWAQGGLAVARDLSEDIAQHVKDTVLAGDGLVDERVALAILTKAPDLLKILNHFGVRLSEQRPALEGGHSKARVIHAKDSSGLAISSALIDSVRRASKIEVFEHALATELLLVGEKVEGLKVFYAGQMKEIWVDFVVLCTGGLGQIFKRSTNPPTAEGDGLALAFRAGAVLADMEFVQFHPTALALSGAPPFLLSEALRGAGATLINSRGRRFMLERDDRAELATRDVISRSIYEVLQSEAQLGMSESPGIIHTRDLYSGSGNRDIRNVWLDLRMLGREQLVERFPAIYRQLLEFGIDASLDLVPVAPAVHYFMGGIATDIAGRTSVPGLYALGEVACTGLHGANRLASNSLLEGGVMAMNLALALSNGGAPTCEFSGPKWSDQVLPAELKTDRRLDWGSDHTFPIDHWSLKGEVEESCGVVRNAETLRSFLKAHGQVLSSEYQNNLTIGPSNYRVESTRLLGALIAESALNREESRGSHYRIDFPDAAPAKVLFRQFSDRFGIRRKYLHADSGSSVLTLNESGVTNCRISSGPM